MSSIIAKKFTREVGFARNIEPVAADSVAEGMPRYGNGAGDALWKEIRLGIVHGIITGIRVGAVIYIVAMMQGDKGPEFLALIVFFATILSVLVSGLCGASVPVVLKRCGADPATASSIILTTATDIVSMGSMLTLATMLIAYLT
jgi:magnesium transporter